MKKLILAALSCLLLAPLAIAGGPASGNFPEANEGGIVTPNQATGFSEFAQYGVGPQGDLLVCPMGSAAAYSSNATFNELVDCKLRLDQSEKPLRVTPIPIKQAVPGGKTFVGFRVVSGYQGHRRLEVYYR